MLPCSDTDCPSQRGGKMIYNDRCSNEILRGVDLPVRLDPEKASVTLNDGLLELEMPKAAPAKKVPIEAKVA